MYRLSDDLVSSIRFVRALTPYKVGDIVAGDEYRTWPEANRRAIVDQGFVELIGGQPAEGAKALERGDLVRVVVPRSDDLFDVVEGRKINEEPLSDEAASALADELPSDPTPQLIGADHDPAPGQLEITNSGRWGGGNYIEPGDQVATTGAPEAEEPPAEELPLRKRASGRPKGSKNKNKPKAKAARKRRAGESGEVPAAAE